MPVQLSYPGVYIEEIQSGVRTITGVPTSTTAFVGTAPRGPSGAVQAVGSLMDYERRFGPVTASALGVAVSLFYTNGGSEALILRIVGPDQKPASVTLPGKGAPKLIASSVGDWGANLQARVDYAKPADGITTYNLTLRDKISLKTERYLGVTTDPKLPRTLARLLKASTLATVDPATALGLPDKHPDPKDSNTDPFAAPTSPLSQDKAAASTGAEAGPPPPPPRNAAAAAPATFSAFAFDGKPQGGAEPTEDDYKLASGDGGLQALTEHNVFFNILVVVPPTGTASLTASTLAAAAQIAFAKRAFMIVDPPPDWVDTDKATAGRDEFLEPFGGDARRNAALYFPRLVLDDLGHTANQSIDVTSFPPAGAVAGLYARTDAERGIWKAPAGLATGLGGAIGLTDVLTDFDSGQLNPVAINALRTLPVVGNVVWGARTIAGSDIESSPWKYVPVRRLALYIEESLFRGTQWVVFEPNDEPLWAQIRLNVGVFMHGLFRQGAFQGISASDAYFVKCDRETTTQADIDLGIVNILVGFAPLKPAEFVVIQLQQISPSLEV